MVVFPEEEEEEEEEEVVQEKVVHSTEDHVYAPDSAEETVNEQPSWKLYECDDGERQHIVIPETPSDELLTFDGSNEGDQGEPLFNAEPSTSFATEAFGSMSLHQGAQYVPTLPSESLVLPNHAENTVPWTSAETGGGIDNDEIVPGEQPALDIPSPRYEFLDLESGTIAALDDDNLENFRYDEMFPGVFAIPSTSTEITEDPCYQEIFQNLLDSTWTRQSGERSKRLEENEREITRPEEREYL